MADSATSALWLDDSLQSSLAELRAHHEQLAGLIDELFVDFEKAEQELVTREEQLAEDACLLDEASPEQLALSLEVEQLKTQRTDLTSELEVTHAQLAELAGTAADLAEARSELSIVRQQLAGGGASEEVRQQLCDIELDRRTLETELDQVRLRAAELQRELSEQKQAFTAQQSQWSAELMHLRKVLERQADLLAEMPHGVLADGGPNRAAANPEAPADDGQDKVVNSLMSQFESLQKDRIRRRASPNL